MPCSRQVVSQHALQVVSQYALQQGGGGEGSPGSHPGGKLRGLVRGAEGVSRPTLGGSPGPHPGGSQGPHPGGVSHHALRQTLAPPRGQLLPRAVRILLKCILV